jgi:hypothetical protein
MIKRRKEIRERVDALCRDTKLMDGAATEIIRSILEKIDGESGNPFEVDFSNCGDMAGDVWKAALKTRETQIRDAVMCHTSVKSVKLYSNETITVTLKVEVFDQIVTLVSEKVMDAAARGESRVCIERPEDIALTGWNHVTLFNGHRFKAAFDQLHVKVGSTVVYVSWD